MDVNETLFSIAMKRICEYSGGLDYRDYRNEIIKLIDNAENLNIVSESNISDIKRLLVDVLDYLSDTGRGETLQLLNTVQFLVHICHRHDAAYDDVETIKELISDQVNKLGIELYPTLGENAKEEVKKAYINWIPKDNNIDEYISYCIALSESHEIWCRMRLEKQ